MSRLLCKIFGHRIFNVTATGRTSFGRTSFYPPFSSKMFCTRCRSTLTEVTISGSFDHSPYKELQALEGKDEF